MSNPDPVVQAIEYYDRRASSMDTAYGRTPAWVRDMVAHLHRALRGRRVLEVACGTGHWTGFAAQVADHVTGVDAAPNMLAVAAAKRLPADRVTFLPGDAFALAEVPGQFDAGLAMQWFSHVPHERLTEFLQAWHARIGSGAAVFLGDNQPWDGMTDKPYAKAGSVDTFETRLLPDGSSFEIVKNYFTPGDLRDILSPYASSLEIHGGKYWWWLSYLVT